MRYELPKQPPHQSIIRVKDRIWENVAGKWFTPGNADGKYWTDICDGAELVYSPAEIETVSAKIHIETGTLTKIEHGATYVIAVRNALSKQEFYCMQTEFNRRTGARLVILAGLES